jgi:hypothetical protein
MPSSLPADERRHAPGAERGWEESWDFDFVAGDGELAGFVRLALRPHDRVAWYWAYLAGRNRDLVVVRDHEVELPKGQALEIRGTGLWAQVICETPLEHWSMGLEASGVAVDDPTDCWRGEWGQPVPLGLDLEWEATATAAASDEPEGYRQPSAVHGEVLLGSSVLDVDGLGWRGHTWGTTPWMPGWWRMAAHLGDGTALCAASGGPAWTYPAGGGDPVTADAMATSEFGPDGLPASATLTAGGLTLAVAPVAHAPVPVDGVFAGLRLVRALCSFSGDGRAGWGWCEWVSGVG